MGRKQTESLEQRELFKFLRLFSPRVPAFQFVFAVPNGGWRDKATAARLRAEGVLPGVWDVLCLARRVKLCESGRWETLSGLAIEMKSATGRLSPDQLAFQIYAEANGFRCVIARSWIEAARALVEYLGVTDEAVLAAIAENGKGPSQ